MTTQFSCPSQVSELCSQKLIFLWSSRGSPDEEVFPRSHGLDIEPNRHFMMSVVYEKTEQTFVDHHTGVNIWIQDPGTDEAPLNR